MKVQRSVRKRLVVTLDAPRDHRQRAGTALKLMVTDAFLEKIPKEALDDPVLLLRLRRDELPTTL